MLFDASLRDLVAATAAAIRDCLESGVTPPATCEPRRCDACSLVEQCLPAALRFQRGARSWFQARLAASLREG